MEIYNFKLFDQGPVERTHKRVYVTLSPKCRLFFNKMALEAIGRPDGVALMYDEEKQAIGVMPARLSRPETRLTHIGPTHSGKAIAALNFCRHFSIVPTETVAFQNPRINHDGVLILSLHQTQPATRPRVNKLNGLKK